MNTPTQGFFSGKTVLVTGAGGSIGSEICRCLHGLGVKELRMVSRTELGLYNIERELRARPENVALKAILASVTDDAAMDRACDGVDIVVHAAAHKHVPLCEKNELEAIENNVGGTIALAQAAHRRNVENFVFVSTDKAVKPKSIMGASKRAAELYLKFQQARSATKFTTVRFGNVLNSSGSVLPLWREQIAKGLPITLTDARCERFFMSIPEAVDLVLGTVALPRPDGLFVFDMGKPRNMGELARELADQYADYDAFGGKSGDSKVLIVETGLRPGEKLTEELSYGGEMVTTSLPKVFRVREDDTRVQKWCDFPALMSAVHAKNKEIALKQLWEIVGG
jgi:FlaA1/EpsC-like NDP-sugar epimerase